MEAMLEKTIVNSVKKKQERKLVQKLSMRKGGITMPKAKDLAQGVRATCKTVPNPVSFLIFMPIV